MHGFNGECTRVADFYHEKSIFVTGATGFFGSILLELLLRCCPGIKSIYILLRPKRTTTPEERKEQVLNKKIFRRIKEKDPELLNKVQVIAGDASYSELKMSEEDIQLIINEVSVVFHCAANISLTQTLKNTLLNNALSVHNVIKLCRRMRKFEALVYTSSAYSNTNHINVHLREEVYRLPFQSDCFLDALQNEDEEKLQEMFIHCKPEWPNIYTFSKCLAENIIVDNASDLPIAIIRPSLIFGTWKQPMPGYEEGRSALSAFYFGVAKGIVKVVYADKNFILDTVPADVVANAHVLVAYCLATRRCPYPMFFHCTATEEYRISLSKCAEVAYQMALKFPFPQSSLKPTECIMTRSKYMFHMLTVYHHYIPAIVLDLMLRISGKKSKIFSSYRAVETTFSSCNFLLFQSYQFERKNLNYIDKLIHPQDREELPLDFKNVKFIETAFELPKASPLYHCNPDEIETQKFKHWIPLVVKCIQYIFLIIINLLLYWILSLIFL